MKTNTKRLISGSAGVAVVVLLFWSAGYDFDTRGEIAFFCALLSLILGAFGAAFPYSE